MMNQNWWKCAGTRAVKTFAQSLIAMIPVGICITDVPWLAVLGTAALASVLSLLTSVAGLPEVETEAEISVAEDEEEKVGGSE